MGPLRTNWRSATFISIPFARSIRPFQANCSLSASGALPNIDRAVRALSHSRRTVAGVDVIFMGMLQGGGTFSKLMPTVLLSFFHFCSTRCMPGVHLFCLNR